ncbi:two pore channel protein 1-like isoform X2 [Montipora capricornis]|uniref:two pore channel protein 1-like isoform X2 n=1 Tax=Montipora capricornis TaxID=246305 RepID=UPI0035F20F61
MTGFQVMNTLSLADGPSTGDEETNSDGSSYNIYQDAAIFLQEGQNNDRFDTHPTRATIRWYLMAHSTFFYVLDLMASLLLLFLGLTEKPASESVIEEDILSLPVPVHGALEIFSLSIIVLELGIKMRWQGVKLFFTHKRTVMKVVILVVMYTEAIVVLIRRENHFRVSRALRPLFLIDTHYCYGVRRVLRQILLSLPPILDMLFLLLFIILIFATLGFFLFSDNEKDEFFTSFWRSFISLFVLLTTANYPDVMMPSYSHSRWSAIFFIVYVSVVLYFLMNLLLAVVYDTFTNIEKDKFRKLFLHKRYAVRKAYKKLCSRSPPHWISWQHFAGLMNFFKSSTSRLEKYLVFKTLDASQTGQLSLEEFYHLFETSEMKWKRVTEHYNQWYVCLKPWKHLYNTVKGIRWLVTRKKFEYCIYVVIALNGISVIVDIILFSNTPQNERYIQRQEIRWYHITFVTIYSAEAFLKIVGLGLRKYLLSGWNVFDFMVTLFGFIGSISPTSFSFIVCLRPFRLLLLFKLKARYRDVFETVGVVLPRMLRVALVILLVYYSFGIIGIECFSGLELKNCCPNTSFGNEYEEGGYYYLNNFNDLLHSYVTLFELTVVNNWFIIMEGIVYKTSDWARIFFMSFYIVTMVVMTIIVAFILEAFLFRMEYRKEHPTDEREDMHIRKEITVSYQELLDLSEDYVRDLEPNQTVKYIGKRSKTKMDLSLKMYKDEVMDWIQKERVIDRGNSLARSVAEERCSPSSPSRTTGSTSVSGGDLGLNEDLSLVEINPIANE